MGKTLITVLTFSAMGKTLKSLVVRKEILMGCGRGETFYPTADTLGVETHKDTPEAINKLAQDVEKQCVPF